MDLSRSRVLVTGVTSGIGEATAAAFCEAGVHELIVMARREERLRELAQAWSHDHGIDVAAIVMDVRDRVELQRIADQHPDLLEVDVLVNNAGLALGTDPMHEADPSDWDDMLDTNVRGLLYLTRAAMPGLLRRASENGASHIVNVGSVAGRWVYPGGGVYCATKHAVKALSEGLRMDLLGTNVRVTNIEPGMVETEFSIVRHRGDRERADRVYEDTRPLRPKDVAEAIVWCVARPDHVNVQELVLYPTDQAHVGQVHRGAPKAVAPKPLPPLDGHDSKAPPVPLSVHWMRHEQAKAPAGVPRARGT
jgi:3-hydroxy acid dehydrogenase / malonic semialdehyde reductase